MNRKKLTKPNQEQSKSFFENPFAAFFLGPVVFIFLVKFTGYQIFYQGDPNSKERRKSMWLLGLGTMFYVLLAIFLISITN